MYQTGPPMCHMMWACCIYGNMDLFFAAISHAINQHFSLGSPNLADKFNFTYNSEAHLICRRSDKLAADRV